ncbi:MAG: hypothetical protein WA816_04035 [Bacteroidales bacterium]
MEIPHHLKHSKKARKTREYLFEFLIIFVAITGSYFAENLREHFVDRHKEKEYMKSMLQDLRSDSANLAKVIELNEEQIKGLDSLLNLFNNKLGNNEILQFCNYDLKYTLNYNAFNPINRTIAQLMNTGGLGLVKEKAVSDGIVGYDNAKNSIFKQADLLETQFTKILAQQTEIFDFVSIMKSRNKSSILNLKKEFPILLTYNKKTMHAYYFNIIVFKGSINIYTQKTEGLLKQATLLIQLIQKVYNL